MDRALNLLRGVLAARRGIDPRQLDDDVDLDDLGLDYLDRVGLVMELEQLLGVRLADARLPELRYLSDLASWLEGAAPERWQPIFDGLEAAHRRGHSGYWDLLVCEKHAPQALSPGV